MLLFNISGCSFSYQGRNSLKVKNNNINREIIENYSKAILKDPKNSYFFLERGRTKHEYGDFVGAIKDFNNSFKINPDIKVIFFRGNSKFYYGDFIGAIKDYEKLKFLKIYKY